jgi:hypothetical protein
MSHVANYELCKALYAVKPNWGGDCEHHWLDGNLFDRMPYQSDAEDESTYAPAFDIDWIMGHIPIVIYQNSTEYYPVIGRCSVHNRWFADYQDGEGISYTDELDAVEDEDVTNAVVKLAIALHDAGILTP